MGPVLEGQAEKSLLLSQSLDCIEFIWKLFEIFNERFTVFQSFTPRCSYMNIKLYIRHELMRLQKTGDFLLTSPIKKDEKEIGRGPSLPLFIFPF